MNTNIEESVIDSSDNLVTISEIDSSDNIRDITNISNSDTSTSSCNAAEFVADLERAFTSNPSSPTPYKCKKVLFTISNFNSKKCLFLKLLLHLHKHGLTKNLYSIARYFIHPNTIYPKLLE